MYKAVIFDFDFTLGDSARGIAESINYALEKLGYTPQNFDCIKKTIGLSLPKTFAVLTGSDDPDAANMFSTYFKEKADLVMVNNTDLYPHTLDTLRNLRKLNIKTAIVTTKFHYRIDAILAKYDANDLIDVIVGGEDVSVPKPAPEGLLFAIDKLGISKENVLYVGDSIVDAKTAQSAGVDFAAVLTGTTSRDEFEVYPNQIICDDLKGVFNYVTSYLQ